MALASRLVRPCCAVLLAAPGGAPAWADDPRATSLPAEAPASAPVKPPAKVPVDRDDGAPAAHDPGDYGGVAPGAARPPSKSRRKPRRPTRPTVTWVGFQKLDDGGARVFLQLSVAGEYDQQVVGNDLVVSLPGMRLGSRNDSRPLDTRFFGTSIASVAARSARVDKKGTTGVEVRIRFKQPGSAHAASASTGTSSDGYQYLYLDFAE